MLKQPSQTHHCGMSTSVAWTNAPDTQSSTSSMTSTSGATATSSESGDSQTDLNSKSGNGVNQGRSSGTFHSKTRVLTKHNEHRRMRVLIKQVKALRIKSQSLTLQNEIFERQLNKLQDDIDVMNSEVIPAAAAATILALPIMNGSASSKISGKQTMEYRNRKESHNQFLSSSPFINERVASIPSSENNISTVLKISRSTSIKKLN